MTQVVPHNRIESRKLEVTHNNRQWQLLTSEKFYDNIYLKYVIVSGIVTSLEPLDESQKSSSTSVTIRVFTLQYLSKPTDEELVQVSKIDLD